MRFFLLLCLVVCCCCCHLGFAQDSESISLATHTQTPELPSTNQIESTKRIRKIILNQGDNARALANLVQLTRELPVLVTSQLYLDLANDYLRQGQYNQAANVLQQHFSQFPDQPNTARALATLVRLYSSSEVQHSQQASLESAGGADAAGFLKYANFLAAQAVQKNPALRDDAGLTFQRAVSTRLAGRAKAAQGRLTSLKHNADAGPWHARARAEHWLLGDREDKPPLPVVVCRGTNERPHLDGALIESLWQENQSIQFAHDEEFLYLALAYPKVAGLAYEVESRTRTYDADLSEHDHIEIRLDLDRDYTTAFTLALDHRGWTNDRCWFDSSWNPQWFVAAGSDATHWTIEAAMPLHQLQASPLQRAGEAWAISWERVVPQSAGTSPPAEAGSPGWEFRLLLFE